MTYSTSESFGTFASSIQKEIQYLERVVKEQQEIIEQLTGTGQPKGYVYMHPLDVSERLTNRDMIVDVHSSLNVRNWAGSHPDHLLELGGRLIKQSPFIPAITKTLL